MQHTVVTHDEKGKEARTLVIDLYAIQGYIVQQNLLPGGVRMDFEECCKGIEEIISRLILNLDSGA